MKREGKNSYKKVTQYRVARQAFGPLPSITALAVLLFLPSLAWSSITLMKESAYFLCSAVVVYCAATLPREPGVARKLRWLALAGATLWLLDDLRRGALVLAGAGLTLAVIIRLTAVTRTRLAARWMLV